MFQKREDVIEEVCLDAERMCASLDEVIEYLQFVRSQYEGHHVTFFCHHAGRPVSFVAEVHRPETNDEFKSRAQRERMKRLREERLDMINADIKKNLDKLDSYKRKLKELHAKRGEIINKD